MTDDVVGQKIVGVRWMNVAELKAEHWESYEKVLVLILENGVKLYPSRDEEGNGGGALFGRGKTGSFYIMPGK